MAEPTLTPKQRKLKNLYAIEQNPDLVEAFTMSEVLEFMLQVAPLNSCLDVFHRYGWNTTKLEKTVGE